MTTDCHGHTKFGTPDDVNKHGGDWGGDWNASGATQTWTWAATSITETSEVRWEVVDQGSHEEVVFSEIDMWVR